MAAASSIIKNATQGSLTIINGAVSLALTYDMGDTAIEGLKAVLNETVKHESRGKLRGISHGNRVYPTFNFSAWFTNGVGSSTSTPGSMIEMLTSLGAYAANGSTYGTGRPVTVGIKLTIEGTDVGDADDEEITATDVDCTISVTESIEGNRITISGEVLSTVIFDNGTNTVTFGEIA